MHVCEWWGGRIVATHDVLTRDITQPTNTPFEYIYEGQSRYKRLKERPAYRVADGVLVLPFHFGLLADALGLLDGCSVQNVVFDEADYYYNLTDMSEFNALYHKIRYHRHTSNVLFSSATVDKDLVQ